MKQKKGKKRWRQNIFVLYREEGDSQGRSRRGMRKRKAHKTTRILHRYSD
jgi:hypothetical protein